jgi:hypothetical protein
LLLLPAVAKGQLIPAGPEFQVNTVTLGYQSFNYTPRVGAAADGRFVVLWPDYPGNSISGRRFDSAGTPVGSDFQLRPAENYKPALRRVRRFDLDRRSARRLEWAHLQRHRCRCVGLLSLARNLSPAFYCERG